MLWQSRPSLNESTLKFQYHRLTEEAAGHLRAVETCREQLADLKARAQAAGLAKVFRALEDPPPFVSTRVEEPLVRVRVVEGFSGQWAGMPYDAPTGAIVDLPRSYVAHAHSLFERVDPATPLFRPPVAVPR